MGEENNNGEETVRSAIIAETTKAASASAVPELLEFVASIERQEGFEPARIEEVASALEAALRITVERSYKDSSGDIKVVCGHDQWGNLVISISDSGEPVNILLADTVFPGEEPEHDEALRKSARLMKRMIDNIEYKRVDRENTLSLFVSKPLRSR